MEKLEPNLSQLNRRGFLRFLSGGALTSGGLLVMTAQIQDTEGKQVFRVAAGATYDKKKGDDATGDQLTMLSGDKS